MPVINPTDADSLPMGANIVENGSGATFRVRAPRAQRVWVRGDFNGWQLDDNGLLHRHGDFWAGFIPDAKAGQKYKFYVKGDLPDPLWKRDPYARELTKNQPIRGVTALFMIHAAILGTMAVTSRPIFTIWLSTNCTSAPSTVPTGRIACASSSMCWASSIT